MIEVLAGLLGLVAAVVSLLAARMTYRASVLDSQTRAAHRPVVSPVESREATARPSELPGEFRPTGGIQIGFFSALVFFGVYCGIATVASVVYPPLGSEMWHLLFSLPGLLFGR
jgi:hypothetical protein